MKNKKPHRGAPLPDFSKLLPRRKVEDDEPAPAAWVGKYKPRELAAGEKPLQPGDAERLAEISRRQLASLRGKP